MNLNITVETLLDFVDSLNKDQEDDINSEISSELSVESEEEEVFSILNPGDGVSAECFPSPFNDMMELTENNVYMLGVMSSIKNKNESYNISFLSSLLTTMRPKINLTYKEYIQEILLIRDKILNDLSSKNLYRQYNYRDLGWKRADLINGMKNFETNNQTIRFLTEYFNINLLIFSASTGKITAVYPEDKYNRFKNVVMMFKIGDEYQPIVHRDKNDNLWRYDDQIVSHIITEYAGNISPLKVITKKNAGDPKIFEIGRENLTKYLPQEPPQEPIKETISDNKSPIEAEDTFKNTNNVVNNYDESSDTEYISEDEQDNKSEDNNNKVDAEALASTDIFYKPKFNEEEDSDTISIPEVTMKMTLGELQAIAQKINVSLTDGKMKNGKDRYKTKKQLYGDIQACD